MRRAAVCLSTTTILFYSVLLTTCSAALGEGLQTLGSPLVRPASAAPGSIVEGSISAPGGPFLYDPYGRTVFFHGVNAVYKRPPYELYVDPGKPWNFDVHDATLLSRMGFNIVRLGMTWKGLEPGRAPANDPAICARGKPHDPHQYNQRIVNQYLERVAQTVALLARFHIYTLLDMHQDVYNEKFDGEGAPNWAVCTDGTPDTEAPGRWSRNYGTVAAGIAYQHFWNNDVVGDLQGEYARVWSAVAARFLDNPWVIGYDPFNEPFSPKLVNGGDEQVDAAIECFYTGKSNIGTSLHGAPKITCPPGTPRQGIIPRLLAVDPRHLIFYETDIYANRGHTNFVGPMNFPNLVLNVHVYCSYRNPKTGNPFNLKACIAQDRRILTSRAEDRSELGTRYQRGGPPWFVSEFGATSDPQVLTQFAGQADQELVGWSYWSWKYYGDPTGSSNEGLLMSNGQLRPTAYALVRPYPQAVSGVPTSMSFDPATRQFKLAYRANLAIREPTLIYVPKQIQYRTGYCTHVQGATIKTKAGSSILQLQAKKNAATVMVSIRPGSCGTR